MSLVFALALGGNMDSTWTRHGPDMDPNMVILLIYTDETDETHLVRLHIW